MPKGFYALIAAQFASGLADNVLMVLGVFFLQEQGYPGWWAPLLKFSFNLAYVVLASVVGPVADAFSKIRLMAGMNVLKLVSVFLLLLGLHPLLAFALTGLSAAIYAPAKYGLVTESVGTHWLVKANAWLEVSVVMSVLLGMALGGWLIGVGVATTGSNEFVVPTWVVHTKLLLGFCAVGLIYSCSIFLNALMRKMTIRSVVPLTRKTMAWRSFWKCNRKLWRDPLGSVSLYITTMFWGAGAVLQFAVLLWAQSEMGLSLQHGAYLQALVAVGVIGGAMLAARMFKTFNARNVLPWGFLLALMMPVMAHTKALWVGVPFLILAGCVAGLMLVPMNALLQQRGAKILSSGRSIAVQGFNENLSVLIMLGAYSMLLAWGVSLATIMMILGALMLVGLLFLFYRMRGGR